jgi:hypothetical protein
MRAWCPRARKFHENVAKSLPGDRAVEMARTLAVPVAQSVEGLTALLSSPGER